MNLLRFDSEAAWVQGACSIWRDRLRTNPRLKMCLPTGVTPGAIYAEMGRSARAGYASFARASVFALDEFGGLPGSEPGLTRNTLPRQLLDAVDLAAGRFLAPDPEAPDVEAECRRYDDAIAEGFDLVLLGIGVNGHVGMNEPGSPPDSPTRRVDLHDTTVEASARYFQHRPLPRWGLTVGLRAILSAKEVWLLARGPSKAGIIRNTVSGPVGPEVPASLLRNHPNCCVFVDAEAGALL